MKTVGIDSCPQGWFYIALNENGDYELGIDPFIYTLCEKQADANLMLIDVPIGLPEDKPRQCDQEARRLLAPERSSSVFPVPCRKAVYAKNYEEAVKTNKEELGASVSKQSWAICKRISQVDSFLTNPDHATPYLRESHPEVCFWAMNSHQPLQHSKKKTEGMRERIAVLQKVWPKSAAIYNEAVEEFKRKDLGRDDILDALVLAVTAMVSHNKLKSVAPVEYDQHGLPMEIVYYG